VRVVYGVNPVRELLRAGGAITELWLADGARGATAEIERLARGGPARVRAAPRSRLDELAGTDRHQGVVALVADFAYEDLDDLLAAARATGEPPLLVVLDQIEDPQNLGAIIRSAHALGAHGVVIPRDRAAGVTAAVAKASAGAVEHTRVARVTNVAQALETLKEAGVWSVATDAAGDRTLAEVDLTGPTALVVGSEGKGVRPLVRRTADHVARIPMSGKVGSLNASAAAAICLYEAARQRSGRPRTTVNSRA
jgi:23S rRNA (guanosine2251-2'-O)-methyltransferase